MLITRIWPASAALAAVVLATLSGCTRDKNAKDLAAMNASNIQRLSNIYAAFQNQKNGRGPNDEAELKVFIREYDPSKLSGMGFNASNLDAVFVSERDGKPFKVRYKVGGGRGSVDPVVFEQDGKDGLKQVGFTGGKVEDVDDASYQRFWAGKGESPPPTGPPATGRPSNRPQGAPTGPPGK